MLLPNFDNAHIELSKLTEYCLNFDHLRGKHKAKVFKSVLGLSKSDAQFLKEAILMKIRTADALKGTNDSYGERYAVDIMIKGNKGESFVRTNWIIRRAKNFPRLTSCYVL